MPRPHRPSPPESRAAAVRLARGSEQSIPALAAGLGAASEALRHWLRQADADAGRGQPGELTTDERAEPAAPREPRPPRQIACGWGTAPTCRRGKAGSPWPSCWTPTRTASSAGRWLATGAELALDALALALGSRRRGAGLVLPTDRGCQYTAAHGVTCSMGRAGECHDDAMAERCFATRKAEPLDQRPWHARAAAKTAVFARLAVWFNRQRRRPAPGYRPPVTFEEDVLLLSGLAA